MEFFEEIKKSYENETNDIKSVDDLFTDIDQEKIKVLSRIKDFQDKTEKTVQEISNIDAEVNEVERLYEAQVLHINDLELKLKERQLEIIKFNELKKNYLLRREKAKANLSKKDALFMESIQNRYKAFKCLTGVRWFYPNCSADHVEGCITNLATHRTKFFEGRPDPDELWHKIEELVNKEDE